MEIFMIDLCCMCLGGDMEKESRRIVLITFSCCWTVSAAIKIQNRHCCERENKTFFIVLLKCLAAWNSFFPLSMGFLQKHLNLSIMLCQSNYIFCWLKITFRNKYVVLTVWEYFELCWPQKQLNYYLWN